MPFWGGYALHRGGIVGRNGRIVADIAGVYFTTALFPTFFLAGLLLSKFIAAIGDRPPSATIRLITVLLCNN